MTLCVALLWLLLCSGSVVCWTRMATLFHWAAYPAGVSAAYTLPTLYTLAIFIAERRPSICRASVPG